MSVSFNGIPDSDCLCFQEAWTGAAVPQYKPVFGTKTNILTPHDAKKTCHEQESDTAQQGFFEPGMILAKLGMATWQEAALKLEQTVGSAIYSSSLS